MKHLQRKWDLKEALSSKKPQEMRAAAFYEYARHSSKIVEFIAKVRKFDVFSDLPFPEASKPKQKDMLEIQAEIARFSRIGITLDFLSYLAQDLRFPRLPFKSWFLRTLVKKNSTLLGGIRFGQIPWIELLAMIERWKSNNQDVEERLKRRNIHAIIIPWNYREEELEAAFSEFLRRIRPIDLPAPAKAGRKGRSGSAGATDMLNQLYAFRLSEAGVGFPSAKTIYTSADGWRRATKRAGERIREMGQRPFFD